MCLNAGTCREEFAYHDYRCDCAPGHTGRNCESREYIHITVHHHVLPCFHVPSLHAVISEFGRG